MSSTALQAFADLALRTGDDRVRRQMLWLLLAVAIVLLAWTVPDFLGIQTSLTLFAIALVPIAIMIAILRYQFLDIRLVVSPLCALPAAVRSGDRRLPGADHPA